MHFISYVNEVINAIRHLHQQHTVLSVIILEGDRGSLSRQLYNGYMDSTEPAMIETFIEGKGQHQHCSLSLNYEPSQMKGNLGEAPAHFPISDNEGKNSKITKISVLAPSWIKVLAKHTNMM